MEILRIILINTAITLIINAITIKLITKQIIEMFKTEEDFDKTVVENIEQILDIIKYKRFSKT